MNRAWDTRQEERGSSRVSRGLPPRRRRHKYRRVAPGQVKAIRQQAERYVAALRRTGGRAVVEIRAGIIFIDGVSYRISHVKAMRKELEARATA